MERRKVKNGEKSPRGQCLTRPVPNGRRRSGFWLVPENLFFLHQSEAGTAATVWNLSGKTLSPWGSSRRSLLFFVPYIFFRPFRLSVAPFICPLVSEDGVTVSYRRLLTSRRGHACEQKQKRFPPLGKKLFFSYKFCENKPCFVLKHGRLVTTLSNRDNNPKEPTLHKILLC